jgi:Arc/MetJ family transcription regulator
MPPDRVLALADDRAGFVAALRRMVGEPGRTELAAGGPASTDPATAAQCRRFAARHSWARRADALAAAIGLTDTTV